MTGPPEPGAAVAGAGATASALGTDENVVDNGHPRDEALALRTTVTVRNPNGLHLRPAAAVAKAAARFRSAVTVRRSDRTANGKSMTSLMLLAAAPGAELALEVVGDDAAEALTCLARILGAASLDTIEANGR